MPGRSTIDGIRKDPSLCGVYSYSLANLPGVVAANNFMSIANPLGSTRFIVVGGFFVSSCAVGTSTIIDPLRGWRSTVPTGGTLATAADIVKYDTRYPDPLGVIRKDNPTATISAPFFNSPPPINQGAAAGQFFHSVEPPPAAGGFILAPGEGVVFRTAAGDVDQTWNLTVVWGEGPIGV